MVADDAGAQALGGVIGGEPTACDEATTERVPRIGAVRSGAHGDDRPDAERPVRRPLPLRARHRSDLGALGPGGGDAADPRPLRRRALRGGRRRRSAAGAIADRLPSRTGCARWRESAATADECARVLAALGFTGDFAGESWAVDAAALAQRHRRRSLSRRGGDPPARLRPHPGGAAAAPVEPAEAGALARRSGGAPASAARWRRAV